MPVTSSINDILGDQALGLFANAPMVDVRRGGQFGYANNLKEWMANQNYLRNQLICFPIRAPKVFSYLPDADVLLTIFNAMFQTHSKTIEGLNGGLSVETESTPLPGGEVHEEWTDVKRTPTALQIGWDEKKGAPFQTLLELWVQYGMASPETKFSLAATLDNSLTAEEISSPEWYTATMLFTEPDVSLKKAFRSWLVTNIFPKDDATGEIIGKKDKTAARELSPLNIPFAGIAQYGLGPNLLAQKFLDQLSLVGANPMLRPAFVDDISSDLSKLTQGTYQQMVNELSTENITN